MTCIILSWSPIISNLSILFSVASLNLNASHFLPTANTTDLLFTTHSNAGMQATCAYTLLFFFFNFSFLSFFKNVLGLNNKVFTMEWKKDICFHINITCLLPVNKRRYKTFLFLSSHTVVSYCRELEISIYWYCVPSQPSYCLTMFHVAAIPSTKQAELNFCFFLRKYPGKQKD